MARPRFTATRTNWFLTDSLQFLGRAVESSARMAGSLFTHSPLQGQVNLLTTGAFDAPGRAAADSSARAASPTSRSARRSATTATGPSRPRSIRATLSSWIADRQLRHADEPARIAISSACRTACTATRAATPSRWRRCPRRRAMSARSTRTTSGRCPIAHARLRRALRALRLSRQRRRHLSPRVSVTLRRRRHDCRIRARRDTARRGAGRRGIPAAGARAGAAAAAHVLAADARRLPRRGSAATTKSASSGCSTARRSACARSSSASTISSSPCSGCARRTRRSADIGHYFVGSARRRRRCAAGASRSRTRSPASCAARSTTRWRTPTGRTSDRSIAGASRAACRRRCATRSSASTTSRRRSKPTCPQSATRVFVLYKMNSAYIRADGSEIASRPRRPLGRAGQSGPAVHELHRAPSGRCSSASATCSANRSRETSVYDELLVARPPKRLVGGITVKF